MSGGELIIVAMAVVALVALAISALAGIVTRLLRGDVNSSARSPRRRRAAPKR